MSYNKEVVNSCTTKLTFNFENLDLSDQIKKEVKSKQKGVQLKGFRKGKAPLAMVEKMYGPEIEINALNRFVQDELYKTIEKEDIKMVGGPKFENVDYKPKEYVKFDAIVEFFPTIEINNLSSLSFKKEEALVTDEEKEQALKSYLESKAETLEVKDEKKKLSLGQIAVLNFEGEKEDGEKPDNMKGSDFVLEIGSGQFIPGFEDGMIGMVKSDKKTIEVTFPENYQAEDLQNAKVKFHVELLEIKEKTYPELTDELAKEFKFESANQMKEKTASDLSYKKNREVDEKLNQEILEKLVSETSFEVPIVLISEQEKYIKQDLTNNLKQQGFNEDMVTEYFIKWKADIASKAEFQVKTGIILDSLAKKFKVEASDKDLDKKIEEMAAMTPGMTTKQIKDYYTSSSSIKNNMMHAIREEKVFSKIKEEVKIN